jgi:CubicO group peptidase (beta-lactamase class C family)
MKNSYLLLVVVALLAALVSYESCQHTAGAGYNEHSYNRAKAYYDSLAFHREALLSSKTTKEIKAGLNEFYTHALGRNFNGAMLVARQGVVIFEKYQGFSDFSNQVPIDRQTTFQLASTSKPFTAMAILYLQQEGLLNINDPIQKFFPQFPYQGVTLKTLLNHRSGLPNYLYFCGQYRQDSRSLMTNQEMIDLMIKYQPRRAYPPDTHYNYCNTNYALLGSVVEKVSGMSLGKFLRKTFFDPLGMKHTYVYNPNRDKPHDHQSLTYDYRTRPIANDCFDGVVGDKNVYSTAEDLLKWDQALYDGKLFTDATLKEAYTPYSNEHPGIKNYGLGWHLLVYPDSSEVVYHNGWWHGNTSVFYRFIDDSTTLIILSNRYNKAIYNVQPVWKILHEASYAVADNDD